jgi:hypothetical protein
MSKEAARTPQSYENEVLVLNLMPPLLNPHDLAAVATAMRESRFENSAPGEAFS